jgi:hypothetical protein
MRSSPSFMTATALTALSSDIPSTRTTWSAPHNVGTTSGEPPPKIISWSRVRYPIRHGVAMTEQASSLGYRGVQGAGRPQDRRP